MLQSLMQETVELVRHGTSPTGDPSPVETLSDVPAAVRENHQQNREGPADDTTEPTIFWVNYPNLPVTIDLSARWRITHNGIERSVLRIEVVRHHLTGVIDHYKIVTE